MIYRNQLAYDTINQSLDTEVKHFYGLFESTASPHEILVKLPQAWTPLDVTSESAMETDIAARRVNMQETMVLSKRYTDITSQIGNEAKKNLEIALKSIENYRDARQRINKMEAVGQEALRPYKEKMPTFIDAMLQQQ